MFIKLICIAELLFYKLMVLCVYLRVCVYMYYVCKKSKTAQRECFPIITLDAQTLYI